MKTNKYFSKLFFGIRTVILKKTLSSQRVPRTLVQRSVHSTWQQNTHVSLFVCNNRAPPLFFQFWLLFHSHFAAGLFAQNV